jgi:hypothetical protein
VTIRALDQSNQAVTPLFRGSMPGQDSSASVWTAAMRPDVSPARAGVSACAQNRHNLVVLEADREDDRSTFGSWHLIYVCVRLVSTNNKL